MNTGDKIAIAALVAFVLLQAFVTGALYVYLAVMA